MNDKVNPSAEPIELSQINPLLAGSDKLGLGDTINNVRSVITTLGFMMLDHSEEPTVGFKDGLFLIHRWLSLTLEFVNDHPNVEKVTPVIEEVRS